MDKKSRNCAYWTGPRPVTNSVDPIDVSVMICVYNGEKLLAKSVESVLAQKGVMLELILVNDGSTDGTLELIKRLASRDSRIKIVNNPKNLGLAASRNRGVEAAVGEWICAVDADDWIEEGRLARLVEAGRRYGVSLVSDDMRFIPEGFEQRSKRLLSHKYRDVCTLTTIEDFIEMSLPRLGGLSWGYMHPLVRLDFLRKNHIGYDENLLVFEDWDYWMRCLLQDNRLLIVGEPYYHYLVAQKSLSKVGSAKYRMELMIGITETIMNLARDKNHLGVLGLLKKRRYLLHRMVLYFEIVEALKSLRFFEALKVIGRNPLAFPYHAIVGFRSLIQRFLGSMGIQAL